MNAIETREVVSIGKLTTEKDNSDLKSRDYSFLRSKVYDWLMPEGSPYKGLSVKEQQTLAKKMRGVGRPPKIWVRKLRKALKADYKSMVVACTNALINKPPLDGNGNYLKYSRVKVILKLPFNFRRNYDKDLPSGRYVAFETYSVYVEFGAALLLDFLFSKGHSKYDSKELHAQLCKFVKQSDAINLYNDIAADVSIAELYEKIIGENDVEL